MNDKELLLRTQTDESLKDWRIKEKLALELLRIVGDLRFDNSIELVLFRRPIYDARPSEVINNLGHAISYISGPISIEDCLDIAKAIDQVENIAPCKVDIGKLATEWAIQQSDYTSHLDFVTDKLTPFITDTENGNVLQPKDLVLYGFGRIGRLVARIVIGQTGKGEQLRLKAIVLRPKLKDRFEETFKRADLLKRDTVHGEFRGTVEVTEDGNEMIINGNRVRVIYAKSPDEIDYTKYGIENALLVDNTGVWRNKEALSIHLRPGISNVMLSAPGDGIPNIVHGVNHKDYDYNEEKIVSAASCTTNAIVPIIKTLDEKFTILKGHVETIHAYTSDQNLLDNFHKKPRRGRGAATNMVLTSTGAAKAVSKVLPHLKGKLTGNAVRVPTPNVSLAIINLTIKESTNRDAIIELIRHAALHGNLVHQIHYSTSTDYVSSQAVGMNSTSVFDAPSTIVSEDGKTITIYAWYDNEFGYTCQLVRLAKYASHVSRAIYY